MIDLTLFSTKLVPYTPDYGEWEADWAAQQSVGCKAFTLPRGAWAYVKRQHTSKADAETNPFLKNAMEFRRRHPEVPVAMHLLFGDDPWGGPLKWNGVDGAAQLFREGNMMVAGHHTEPECADVFHTGVSEAFKASGKANLAEFFKTLHGDLPTLWASYVGWCPATTSPLMRNAYAKVEEFCKWIRPDFVSYDVEKHRLGVDAIPNANGSLNLPRTATTFPCKRCGSLTNYWQARATIARNLFFAARRYTAGCKVAFYDCYAQQMQWPERCGPGDFTYAPYMTGAPDMYWLSASDNADTMADIMEARKEPLRHNDGYPWNQECVGGQNRARTAQPEAIRGAMPFVTLCRKMGPGSERDAGEYVSEAKWIDICQTLKKLGAVGLQICPGYYHEPCPNNDALDRLLKVGIEAFRKA